MINFSYNYVGQRIAISGSIQEPSVWENGRHVLDFQIGKTWKEKYELKLNCERKKLIPSGEINGRIS